MLFWERMSRGRPSIDPMAVVSFLRVRAATGRLIASGRAGDGGGEDVAALREAGRVLDAVGERIVAGRTRPWRPNWRQIAARLVAGTTSAYRAAAARDGARVRRLQGQTEDLATRLWLGLGALVAVLALVGAVVWRAIGRHQNRLLGMLRRVDGRARSLARNASDLVLVSGGDGRLVYASPSAERVLGLRPEDAHRTTLGDLVHPEDRSRLSLLDPAVTPPGATSEPVEWRLSHGDGTWATLECLVANRCEDPEVGGFVVNARDIGERKAMEEALAHQAFHDSLTGLANRALFTDRLAHALRRGARHGDMTGVLLVDLDDFKMVNDSLGHAVGDRLLVDVARRIRACLRDADTAARLGGDEFAVLIEGMAGPQGVERLADRIVAALGEAGPDRRSGAGGQGQPRHLGGAGGRARRAGPLARRGRRPVRREGRRQGLLPGLRAEDAACCRTTADDAHQARPRPRARRAGPPLSAHRGPRGWRRRRRGGARPVAPSAARDGSAERLHPDRRGVRADHADGAVGARGRLSPDRRARWDRLRAGALRERERVSPAVRPAGGSPTTSAARWRRPASPPTDSSSRSPRRR